MDAENTDIPILGTKKINLHSVTKEIISDLARIKKTNIDPYNYNKILNQEYISFSNIPSSMKVLTESWRYR